MANGSNAWAAASICSAVVIALGGAFGSSYVRDQSRMEGAIRELQSQREDYAHVRGRTDQRLDQLSDLTHDNEQAIRDGLTALDEVLQREMRILDSAVQVQLDNMDRRLQNEMRTLFEEHRSRIELLRAWIEKVEPTLWTVEDQRRFEDLMGLKVQAGGT